MHKREVHTRGVIIARRAAGEGSVRVQLYTEALGLVSAVAKSAREERSKLRPYLLPGTFGTYSVVKGKAEWRVTGVVGARTPYFACSRDDQRISAERVVQLVRTFVHGEGADEALFAAVWEFLSVVPTLSPDDTVIGEYVAALRILAALGYVAPTDETREFLSPEYSAALLAHARAKRKGLVEIINHGLGASGLSSS